MKHWKKFYSCDCATEGLMMSYELREIRAEEPIPYIDLGYWKHAPQYNDHRMTFKQKLRWVWQILVKGEPFNDMVMLDKKTALELANDLMLWGLKDSGLKGAMDKEIEK